MSNERQTTARIGEQFAHDHLLRLGCQILDRNYHYSRVGELDIVAYHQGVVIFCEVKTRICRSGTEQPNPFEAITAAKQLQVRRLASAYLREKRPQRPIIDLRCDAIAVLVNSDLELTLLNHLRGAF